MNVISIVSSDAVYIALDKISKKSLALNKKQRKRRKYSTKCLYEVGLYFHIDPVNSDVHNFNRDNYIRELHSVKFCICHSPFMEED